MKLNERLTRVEKFFNIAGSVPVVGIFSGAARATAGQVQFLAGFLFGAVGLIAQIFSHSPKWGRLAENGVMHIIHGDLNYLRGTGEFILGVTILGSVALLAIQTFRKQRFEPIVGYNDLQGKLGFA